jgi:hypothetical protein
MAVIFVIVLRLRLLRFRRPVFVTIDFDRKHSMAVHHYHIHWLEMLLGSSHISSFQQRRYLL